MTKKKYEGSYNPSLLKPLIEKGKVYVECAHCGTQIDNWAVIMSSKCPNCHQDHGIIELINRSKKQQEQEDYGFIKELLLNGKACIVETGKSGTTTHREGLYSTPTTIRLLTGESAWESFVHSPCRWAFVCVSCKYIHFLNPPSLPSDAIWIKDLYDVRRGNGYPSPDNWDVRFICQKCGFENTFMRHPGIVMSELKQHRESLLSRLFKLTVGKVK
jgi:predicted RNA-binding Zn-ribbon protein involved in translation (DUF1610 family)